MTNNSNNVWRLFWTLIHEWFCATFIHLYIIHTILAFRNNNNNQRNNERGKLDRYIIKTIGETRNNRCMLDILCKNSKKEPSALFR
ncbi:unnamed protein product [Rotaria sp. Silwood2]|nr:unnamed protein product [Rotaria sp. Silwood2]CAF4009781.1 unnamed protein product [Rotaria sp. Silwood2]